MEATTKEEIQRGIQLINESIQLVAGLLMEEGIDQADLFISQLDKKTINSVANTTSNIKDYTKNAMKMGAIAGLAGGAATLNPIIAAGAFAAGATTESIMRYFREKMINDKAHKYLNDPSYRQMVDKEAAIIMQKLSGPQKLQFQNAIAKYKQDLKNYK